MLLAQLARLVDQRLLLVGQHRQVGRGGQRLVGVVTAEERRDAEQARLLVGVGGQACQRLADLVELGVGDPEVGEGLLQLLLGGAQLLAARLPLLGRLGQLVPGLVGLLAESFDAAGRGCLSSGRPVRGTGHQQRREHRDRRDQRRRPRASHGDPSGGWRLRDAARPYYRCLREKGPLCDGRESGQPFFATAHLPHPRPLLEGGRAAHRRTRRGVRRPAVRGGRGWTDGHRGGPGLAGRDVRAPGGYGRCGGRRRRWLGRAAAGGSPPEPPPSVTARTSTPARTIAPRPAIPYRNGRSSNLAHRRRARTAGLRPIPEHVAHPRRAG